MNNAMSVHDIREGRVRSTNRCYRLVGCIGRRLGVGMCGREKVVVEEKEG